MSTIFSKKEQNNSENYQSHQITNITLMSLTSAICTSISSQSGALLCSVLTEAITAGGVGCYWLGNPVQLAGIAIGATLITHPVLWLLFAVGEGYLSYGMRLVLLELAVAGAEALAFRWVMR